MFTAPRVGTESVSVWAGGAYLGLLVAVGWILARFVLATLARSLPWRDRAALLLMPASACSRRRRCLDSIGDQISPPLFVVSAAAGSGLYALRNDPNPSPCVVGAPTETPRWWSSAETHA